MDGGSSRQAEGERQRSCQTNRNLIRGPVSGCPQCVHTLSDLIMNNPLRLINKRCGGMRPGRRGEGVKEAGRLLLQQEAAVSGATEGMMEEERR